MALFSGAHFRIQKNEEPKFWWWLKLQVHRHVRHLILRFLQNTTISAVYHTSPIPFCDKFTSPDVVRQSANSSERSYHIQLGTTFGELVQTPHQRVNLLQQSFRHLAKVLSAMRVKYFSILLKFQGWNKRYRDWHYREIVLGYRNLSSLSIIAGFDMNPS